MCLNRKESIAILTFTLGPNKGALLGHSFLNIRPPRRLKQ